MPQTVISPLPAPDICAPQEQRKSARSAISGSRAALKAIISPSADAAAISIFSVAPTWEREGYFFSAETVGTSAREHAALGLNLCAHKAQGGTGEGQSGAVLSRSRRARISPPYRALRAGATKI